MMESNYHAEVREFSNNELIILRRLYEMEKEDWRKEYTYGAVVPYAKKNGYFGLWSKFKKEGVKLFMNGGPKDLDACSGMMLWPEEWIESKEKAYWSMFDRDEELDKLLFDLGFSEMLG